MHSHNRKLSLPELSQEIEQPSKNPMTRELFSLLKSIAIFLIIALMLRASVVEAFKIPSSSMEQTLEIGDHILVNKLSYGLRLPLVARSIFQFREPQREDVVVFTLPDKESTPEVDESKTNIIKRVVGLPGDQIALRGTNLYVNGRLYHEKYSRYLRGGTTDLEPITIPNGHVLLMGDNRDYSKDSRFWDSPFLEIERIKGRAFIIYWNSSFLFGRMFNLIR